MLGNIVISKKILRTRKIMVMHSNERMSSAHVQLDDDPRTPIQQGVGDEFRQHDGVVTMMMFYQRRASPKHRCDIIEVDYGGGGHHTPLRDQ